MFLEEIGRGGFGRVSKVVWRGSIVAAKEIPTAGNSRILENELAVYRYTVFLATLPQAIFSYPKSSGYLVHQIILTHLLSLLGIEHSVIFIMNYVTLHNLIFGDKPQVCLCTLYLLTPR